jgi:hypothetical protein
MRFCVVAVYTICNKHGLYQLMYKCYVDYNYLFNHDAVVLLAPYVLSLGVCRAV